MKTIKVHSLPLMDVIIGFAKRFGTDYSHKCGEYSVALPENWGKGTINSIEFEGGVGMIHYNCIFYDDVEIQFIKDKIHPLKFLFCLEGLLEHRFADEEQVHTLEQFQNVIVASKLHKGHILNFSKNQYTNIYSLEINRSRFNKKLACDMDTTAPKLQVMFDEWAKNTFYYEGYYSLILSVLFQELKESKYDGLIKKIFLESKAYQILTHQLIQYTDDEKDEPNRHLLRKSEVKSIMAAIVIIETELEVLGSIGSIALRVGINNNKIQDGFQSLFGLSVNSYIQRYRLEIAKNLLIKTDFPIHEIMQKVGWNSKSYFSKIFRDTYNITPTEFRSQRLKED